MVVPGFGAPPLPVKAPLPRGEAASEAPATRPLRVSLPPPADAHLPVEDSPPAEIEKRLGSGVQSLRLYGLLRPASPR